MNFLCPIQNDEKSGVPLGGIGGGTIGRGFRGEFCHFQMKPGMYCYKTVAADQFIVNIQNEENQTVFQKVLTTQRKPSGGELSSWDWTFDGEFADYTALYPRAWTHFNVPEHNIQLICQQISPVIPHNYKDSCLPAAVFEWKIINNSTTLKKVSITFTMKNGTGEKEDKSGLAKSKTFERSTENIQLQGIIINQEIDGNPYSYTVGVESKPDIVVTRCTYFNPRSDGKSIWGNLKKTGQLESKPIPEYHTSVGEELGCGTCARTDVLGGSTKTVTFSLAWDMPKIYFPCSKKQHTRYYTKYFGNEGNAGPDMCSYALGNYKRWETEICKWQDKYLSDPKLPAWYKSALLNELYYISDGGTLWLLIDESENLPTSDPRLEYGRFAYLEGHEYHMYNTYDVHFYASFALAMLWPKLQTSLQYDIRDSIEKFDDTIVWYLYDGKRTHRKTKGTVPHDIGDPDEDPFTLLNAYNIHDVSEWRDLNLKFVLQVYRDFSMHNNVTYLKDMFPQIITVIDHAIKWDMDNDGMIENSGAPDQTYDAWIMTGTSAYCGSLWVATLYAATEIARILDNHELEQKYLELFKRAISAFENKLWNGMYYNFDTSKGNHSESIMTDQLCGLWYLRCSLVDKEIFPCDNVKSALQTVYEYNVQSYFDGTQGAVNGMMPNRKVDTFAVQSEEVWTGVSYSVASLMIFEGMLEEGLATAKGIYETVYEKSGLGFATPEALHGLDSYRSVGYMRPLSIWSIQLAIEKGWN